MTLFLLLNTKEDLWRTIDLKTIAFFHMEVNGAVSGYQHSSKYILLCLAERGNSYRFGLQVEGE